jgi:hypothetical protein
MYIANLPSVLTNSQVAIPNLQFAIFVATDAKRDSGWAALAITCLPIADHLYLSRVAQS